MQIKIWKLSSCILSLLGLLIFTTEGQTSTLLPARLSANAYAGNYAVGQADLMLSLQGDEKHNLYLDPQGAYGSDQQWYGDVGLGYRWIKNDAAILGWYLFAGHSRVENSSGFWITNPGVEVMGSRWDARINAYIPVAGRSNEVGNVDYNIVSEPFFTGHTEVIVSEFNVANEIQQIGNGADARVGYQFFSTVPLKGYLGAYFFGIANTDNVRGGAAGMEYWFDSNIRVFANYSYDNYQHSKVVGGLGISFGGVRNGHNADPSLSERLTDPVERYLANLGHGSGIPSKTLLFGMGSGSSTQLISSDIAFFSQTGTPNNGGTGLTLANCTFENPCGPTDFSQTSVDTFNTLLANTNFYFNGSSYSAGVSLNAGQSVRSRTMDYTQPATGASRSTFNGTINLTGNNVLENIILLPSGASVASLVSGPNNLITGSQIGTMSAPAQTGVQQQSGSLIINNSTIFADNTAVFADGAFTPVTTSITNSQINVNSNASNAEGINAEQATLTVNNTQIEMNGSALLVGIATQDTSLEANNTSITLTSTGASGSFAIGNILDNSILFNGGELNASGIGAMIVTDTTGVTISASTICRLNGTTVACP